MADEDEEGFDVIISDSGGCTGSFNMSADLFLLNKYKIWNNFSSRPTLRVYYFSPPALSFGYFQGDKEIDYKIIERTKKKGYDVVSRPTGGRAVLHKNEITYSITASYKNGIFAGKLMETYKKIGRFLYLFFVKLGLKPDSGDISASGEFLQGSGKRLKNNFNCFLKAHPFEITFGEKKICGNSQRRSGGAFLQHGSIYIDYNPAEHIEIFTGGIASGPNGGGDYSDYFNNVTGIRQEMENAGIDFGGSDLSFENLSKIMVESFSEIYGLNANPVPSNIFSNL